MISSKSFSDMWSPKSYKLTSAWKIERTSSSSIVSWRRSTVVYRKVMMHFTALYYYLFVLDDIYIQFIYILCRVYVHMSCTYQIQHRYFPVISTGRLNGWGLCSCEVLHWWTTSCWGRGHLWHRVFWLRCWTPKWNYLENYISSYFWWKKSQGQPPGM